MSVEENKALIRRVIEELNKGNLAVLDESMADNFIWRGAGGREMDREGYKQFIAMLGDAFPGLQCTIDEIVAEGDKVAVRFILAGTNKGNFMGMPPTGKQINLSEDYFCRFEGGKIVEYRNLLDSLAFYQQLGITPPSANG